jgi:ubiquinol oxidase
MKAPSMARDYYELPEGATLRDLILSVRADESIHRDINHRFSDLPSEANTGKELHDFLEKDSRLRKRI